MTKLTIVEKLLKRKNSGDLTKLLLNEKLPDMKHELSLLKDLEEEIKHLSRSSEPDEIIDQLYNIVNDVSDIYNSLIKAHTKMEDINMYLEFIIAEMINTGKIDLTEFISSLSEEEWQKMLRSKKIEKIKSIKKKN